MGRKGGQVVHGNQTGVNALVLIDSEELVQRRVVVRQREGGGGNKQPHARVGRHGVRQRRQLRLRLERGKVVACQHGGDCGITDRPAPVACGDDHRIALCKGGEKTCPQRCLLRRRRGRNQLEAAERTAEAATGNAHIRKGVAVVGFEARTVLCEEEFRLQGRFAVVLAFR